MYISSTPEAKSSVSINQTLLVYPVRPEAFRLPESMFSADNQSTGLKIRGFSIQNTERREPDRDRIITYSAGNYDLVLLIDGFLGNFSSDVATTEFPQNYLASFSETQNALTAFQAAYKSTHESIVRSRPAGNLIDGAVIAAAHIIPKGNTAMLHAAVPADSEIWRFNQIDFPKEVVKSKHLKDSRVRQDLLLLGVRIEDVTTKTPYILDRGNTLTATNVLGAEDFMHIGGRELREKKDIDSILLNAGDKVLLFSDGLRTATGNDKRLRVLLDICQHSEYIFQYATTPEAMEQKGVTTSQDRESYVKVITLLRNLANNGQLAEYLDDDLHLATKLCADYLKLIKRRNDRRGQEISIFADDISLVLLAYRPKLAVEKVKSKRRTRHQAA